MNTSTIPRTLESLGLSIYAYEHYLFLVEDVFIVTAFIRSVATSTNSVRVSVYHDNTWSFHHKISAFADVKPMTREDIGDEVYNFMLDTYLRSHEYRAKRNPYEERVVHIQKEMGFIVPSEVAKMLAQAMLPENEIADVLYDLRKVAPYYVMDNDEYANILMNGTKHEKKMLIKDIINSHSYKALDVENRGKHYTNVIADMLLCLYSAA